MSVEMNAVYQGSLHCEAEHGPSGAVLQTDAPRDNEGRGEAFSPTDLTGAALLSCMLTTMGIVAKRHGFEITGARGYVTKEMVADPHRRVAALKVEIHMPGRLEEAQRRLVEQAALGCPVQHTLDPRIDRPVTFHWPTAQGS